MKQILSLMAMALTLGAMAQATPDTVCTLNCGHPGYRSFSETYPTTGGDGETVSREYILHVPAGYDPAVAAPLVIVYHGFGDCASYWEEHLGQDLGFNALADEEGFLVAYPQGAYRPSKESTYWEPGNGTGDHLYDNDVYFTQQLIADVAADHNVAAGEVYVAGYSNGGMMAYSVGCTRGDMVAGVGVMSGAMLDDAGTCDPAHPVPVIVFHGVGDYVLPYNGNEWYASVADVVNLWLDHNGIPAASQTTASLNGGNVVHDAYSGGNGGTCLSLYTVEQEFGSPGGHVWFSQAMDGVSPSRILWEFFSGGCSAVSAVDAVDGAAGSGLEVHPNPFSDRLSIEGLNGAAMPYALMTSAGRMVREGEVGPAGTIDGLEDLPAGVYVLRAAGRTFRLVH
ncbi:MAG: alpha/beta hydrolase-fold protein [Flavobacteriales bacterium]